MKHIRQMVLIVAVLHTSIAIFEKSSMNLGEQMEQIYADIPLDSIP